MKNRLHKIPAFTLSEMIVVLLITTIVVGMAFAVLNLVQKQMNGIEKNYAKNTEFNLMRQSFWIDFNRFDKVIYNAGNNELTFTNAMNSTRYLLGENSIIREKDTFFLKWETQKFYFENTEVSLGEIDAIDFKTSKAFGSQQLFVYKTNAATTYMNH